jgi:hypothetical protein
MLHVDDAIDARIAVRTDHLILANIDPRILVDLP